jgi:hypothetical protein
MLAAVLRLDPDAVRIAQRPISFPD